MGEPGHNTLMLQNKPWAEHYTQANDMFRKYKKPRSSGMYSPGPSMDRYRSHCSEMIRYEPEPGHNTSEAEAERYTKPNDIVGDFWSKEPRSSHRPPTEETLMGEHVCLFPLKKESTHNTKAKALSTKALSLKAMMHPLPLYHSPTLLNGGSYYVFKPFKVGDFPGPHEDEFGPRLAQLAVEFYNKKHENEDIEFVKFVKVTEDHGCMFAFVFEAKDSADGQVKDFVAAVCWERGRWPFAFFCGPGKEMPTFDLKELMEAKAAQFHMLPLEPGLVLFG